jgi:hypothetical protein
VFFLTFVIARNKLKLKANGNKEELRKSILKISTLDIRVAHCREWQNYDLAVCGTV